MADQTRPLPIPDWMVIDAARYAMGRATYQASVTARWLVAHWSEIPPPAREIIRRDMEEHYRRGDLGWDCDRDEWDRVRALWTDTPTTEEPRHE